MRICIVADQFPKLSETFVLRQVEGLRKRGHDVSVLCNARGAGTSPCPVRRRWGVLGALRPRVDQLSSGLQHRARRTLDLLDAKYLKDFDVILAHFGYEGKRLASMARRVPNLPPLVTIYHGHDVSTVAHDNAFSIYDDLFAVGALHLAVNDRFRQTLVGAGAPAHLTRTHHMGIHLADFPFVRRDWQRRPTEILSVCRLTAKKGIADALEAIDRLHRNAPDLAWRYRIVGEGELSADLQQQRARLSTGDRIEFLGAQRHNHVQRLMAESHIFLLPSVTAPNGDAEGVPVSLMEAMASGAVPVSTHHSGIPELIDDGVSGFLAPEGCPAILAEKMQEAMSQPDRLGSMATVARERVEADFNEERQLDELERALAAALIPPAEMPASCPSSRVI